MLAPLSQLPVGVTAVICCLKNSTEVSSRLRALGIRPGKQVHIVRNAAFAGPLQVRAGQTDIILRRNEANEIFVET